MVEFNENSGLLIYDGVGGGKKTQKYSKPANLKNFYMEMHNLLVEEGYKDMLGTEDKQKKGDFQDGWSKAGEFIDGKNNRAGDIFEKQFFLVVKPVAKDIEILWKAFKKTPYSKYGWMEFEMNLSNRFMQDKEYLEGNNKKVLQGGSWEFRNSFVYKNNVILEYLDKIPFVKNSPILKNFYINYIYKDTLQNDANYCDEKLHPKLQKLIDKHFT